MGSGPEPPHASSESVKVNTADLIVHSPFADVSFRRQPDICIGRAARSPGTHRALQRDCAVLVNDRATHSRIVCPRGDLFGLQNGQRAENRPERARAKNGAHAGFSRAARELLIRGLAPRFVGLVALPIAEDSMIRSTLPVLLTIAALSTLGTACAEEELTSSPAVEETEDEINGNDDVRTTRTELRTLLLSGEYADIGRFVARATDRAKRLGAGASGRMARAALLEMAGQAQFWAATEAVRDTRVASSKDPAATARTIAAESFARANENLTPWVELVAAGKASPRRTFAVGGAGVARIVLGGGLLQQGDVARGKPLFESGMKLLDQSASTYPELGYFNRGVVRMRLAKTDAEEVAALEDFRALYKSCLGEPMADPARLKISVAQLKKLEQLGVDAEAGKIDRSFAICGNTKSVTPHSIESTLVTLGDVLTKTNRPADAKEVYQLAKSSSSFRTWPFRAVVDKRVADAERNAAAFHDADPTNDPPLGEAGCSGCHRARSL